MSDSHLDLNEFAKLYADSWAKQQEEEKSKMSVRWTVRSEEVHHSKATWIGEKPKDGGLALLIEMFNWIHSNEQVGKMVIHFGTGGSVSYAEFEQSERVPSPVAQYDSDEIQN